MKATKMIDNLEDLPLLQTSFLFPPALVVVHLQKENCLPRRQAERAKQILLSFFSTRVSFVNSYL